MPRVHCFRCVQDTDDPKIFKDRNLYSREKGNVVPASHYGMEGDWPSEMLVTVTLEEDGGKTVMTLQHEDIPPEIMSDCEAGWSGSFDKLSESLK